MPLSVLTGRVLPMHRQIAGKLTGPITKWIVLVAVIVIAGGLGSFAGKLIDVQNNETESWLPESAESTKAFEKLEAFQDPYDVGTTVVYHRASGLTAEDMAAIEEDATEIAKIDGISAVLSPEQAKAAGVPTPFVSEDGEVAKLEFTVNYGDKLWEELPDLKPEIDDIIKIDGVDSYLAGAGGQSADAATIFSSGDSNLLLITLGVVVLILLVTYRSPILWLLPIISAVVGLGASMGLLYFLAKHTSLTVNGQTQFILTVLVIGAGTDYALLLVARYREELRRHEDRHEAMAFALHRAAPAILASAATVVVGLLVPHVRRPQLHGRHGSGRRGRRRRHLRRDGDAAPGPAGDLRTLGLLAGFVPKFGSEEPTASGLWARVGRSITPRPRIGVGRYGGRPRRPVPGLPPHGHQRHPQRRAVHPGAGLA